MAITTRTTAKSSPSVRQGKVHLLANISYAAEHIEFIPPRSGTYYQTQLCLDRENGLLAISSSQFLNRTGRMIVVNELSGELWEVAWDGERYTPQQHLE